MAEKEQKSIRKAFADVRNQQGDALNRTIPYESGRPYSYEGDQYSESYAKTPRAQGVGTVEIIEDSIHSDDAEIKRVKERGPFLTDESIEYGLTVATPAGKSQYAADSNIVDHGPEARSVDSSTTIVREDKDGNEVYRFTSKNPDLADKVGAVAAKRIINAPSNNQSERAA